MNMLHKYGNVFKEEAVVLEDLFNFTEDEIATIVPDRADRHRLARHVYAMKTAKDRTGTERT